MYAVVQIFILTWNFLKQQYVYLPLSKIMPGLKWPENKQTKIEKIQTKETFKLQQILSLLNAKCILYHSVRVLLYFYSLHRK